VEVTFVAKAGEINEISNNAVNTILKFFIF
jgi:hypothetical protein